MTGAEASGKGKEGRLGGCQRWRWQKEEEEEEDKEEEEGGKTKTVR